MPWKPRSPPRTAPAASERRGAARRRRPIVERGRRGRSIDPTARPGRSGGPKRRGAAVTARRAGSGNRAARVTGQATAGGLIDAVSGAASTRTQPSPVTSAMRWMSPGEAGNRSSPTARRRKRRLPPRWRRARSRSTRAIRAPEAMRRPRRRPRGRRTPAPRRARGGPRTA